MKERLLSFLPPSTFYLLPMHNTRIIVHIDMDAFFASVEQRDNPALRGKPVVVGADPREGTGRGVVSTCSYEARKFGIHSAMPVSQAYRLCPCAVFIRPHMEKYADVSRRIRRILYDFSPDIEQASIDEAYLDITGTYRIFSPSAAGACRVLKQRIRQETGLTSSVGIAPTMMAAKIASDLKKPDGLVEVKPEGLLDFLWPLDVGRIWGLGGKAQEVLSRHGIRTIGELARTAPAQLVELFGRNGLRFRELALGRDDRMVEPGQEVKSISSETTFGHDTRDAEQIDKTLMRLCEEVSSRLRQEHSKGRTITLKVRLSGFQTYTRSLTVAEATNFADVIARHVRGLYGKFEHRDRHTRLVGVRVSGLSPAGFPDSLFVDSADLKREEVHKAVEKIRRKFGDDAINRAVIVA